MAKMKVARVTRPGGPIELVEREVPQPGEGQVRVRVLACGICHSDALTKDGQWPGIQYPRVPGHEIAGLVDEVGAGVIGWEKGQRVGVGWYGGHCGHCSSCRRGDFMACQYLPIPGITFDGGYQEHMVVSADALALRPDGISAEEAAPLLCAGITTYNALRHSGARPGDLVAIQGVGGLGHLGIQFANKFGYKVAAVSRGSDNAALAKKLGAHHYIDSQASNPAEELKKLGGARVILATAPSGHAMTALFDGLGTNGKMVVVGASMEAIQVTPMQLITGRRSLQGWPAGTSADSEDTLNFSVLTGVRPMIETFPLDRAAEAYERMTSGKAEYRVVLTMSAA
jgi:D-arabinose 1-dehydrogenase-like Zn-dependent alcohol dehydrogenase